MTTPEHLSICERCSTEDQKAPQTWKTGFAIKASQMFWPFILKRNMNTDFQILLQWT